MTTNVNDAEIEELFTSLKQAVKKAGEVAKTFHKAEVRIEEKSDGSKVSEADYAVNDFLQKELTNIAPDFAWISEESPISQDRLKNQYAWIVDPIDGTNSFIQGGDHWTIVASLIHNHQPILGVVDNPVLGEFYCAAQGKGATLNGKSISVNPNKNLSDAHIISSKGHFNRCFEDHASKPHKRTWIHSIAYRIALVASGAAEATMSLTPKNDWDIAAAHIILNEAGGHMAEPDGTPITYNNLDLSHNGIVAVSSALYNEVIDATKKARPIPKG